MKLKISKVVLFNIILNMMLITYTYALSPQDNLSYEGIDVSNWQGNIDFAEVKKAGIKIVYIKASEGTTFKDPYLERNYAKAKENDLKVGFYHYLTATTTIQAENQAIFFESVIQGKEVDCKLAMDYEEFFGVNVNQRNQIAMAFIKKLKQITGKDVIVYSNLNNIQNTFNSSVANEGKLWIAYYNNIQNLIDVSSAWDTYIGIQYTSSGRVPGITGNVDRDRFSKEILIDELQDSISSGDGGNDKHRINYIVKRGDTLSAIALKYGTTVSEIARMNGIQNINLIYPGQILKIVANSNIGNNPNITQKVTYRIRRGDTLWQISKNYGVSIQNIVTWNNIRNPNLIYAGNTLVLYVNGSSDNISSGIIQYRVKRGDSLWKIATRYGTTVSRIAEINRIKNVNRIFPGQILFIY